jgi:hypothetical protein
VHYFNFGTSFIGQALMDYFSISKGAVESYMNAEISANALPFKVLSDKVSLIGLAIAAGFIYITYWLRANRSHN